MNGHWFMAHESRLKARGSWFEARGPGLGQEMFLARGPGAWGTPRQFLLGREP